MPLLIEQAGLHTLFRAVLLRIFARLFGPLAGLLLSALCSGLAHLSHDSWLGAGLVVVNAGLLFGLAYLLTGSLWLAVGIHVGYDFFEGSVLGVNNPHGLLQSNPDLLKPIFLTGGTSGPDSSALSALVGLGTIFVLLAVRARWQRNARQADVACGPRQT